MGERGREEFYVYSVINLICIQIIVYVLKYFIKFYGGTDGRCLSIGTTDCIKYCIHVGAVREN